MSNWLLILSVHALVLCGLALLVYVVSACLRRPAISHALWLILLVKFLFPGVYQPRVFEQMYSDKVASEDRNEVQQSAVVLPESKSALGSEFVTSALPGDRPAPEASAKAVLTAPVPLIGSTPLWPLVAVVVVWILGSHWTVFRIAVDVRRTGRLRRLAVPVSEELQSFSDRIAGELRLRKSPIVLESSVAISPMVWAYPWQRDWVILLPRELIDRCDETGLRTILIHELCHLHRRDHLVRYFELLVTVIFWWHPVLWWTLRELRRAADQCCDAWVVRLMPESRRTYAESLLETLDFLSEATVPTPRPAHSIGEVSFLKRRVRMIMKGTRSAHTSWGQKILLGGVGLALLAVTPLARAASTTGDEEAAAGPTQEVRDNETGSGKRKGGEKEEPKPEVSIVIEINGKTSRFTSLGKAGALLTPYKSKLQTGEGFDSFQMDMTFHGRKATYREPYEARVAIGRLQTMLHGIKLQGLDLTEVLKLVPATSTVIAPSPVVPNPNYRRDGIGVSGPDGIDGGRNGKAGKAGASGAEVMKDYLGKKNGNGGAGKAGQPGSAGGGGLGGGVGGGAPGPGGNPFGNGAGQRPQAPSRPPAVQGKTGQSARGRNGVQGKSFQKRTANNPTGAYRTGDKVNYTYEQRLNMAARAIDVALTPGFLQVSTHLTSPNRSSRMNRQQQFRFIGRMPGKATLLARSVHRDYEKATFSFEHGIRDDPKRVTYNDWDLQYGNGGDFFSVAMGMDDRSRIVDLGARTWSADRSEPLPVLTPHDRWKREKVRAVAGHMYLVRTVDRETDLYAIFRVERVEDGECDITWHRLEPATKARSRRR